MTVGELIEELQAYKSTLEVTVQVEHGEDGHVTYEDVEFTDVTDGKVVIVA